MEFQQIDHAAPADTVLGMLQRGRGAGWREAAVADEGAEPLLTCLSHEPCWDHQVESRADYYATLALRLSVPAADILAVREDDAECSTVMEVLNALACRGSVDAADLLRDMSACDEFADDGGPGAGLPRRSMQPAPIEAPIEVLLGSGWRRPYPKALVHRLAVTRDEREIDALREASQNVDGPGWYLAVRVLSRRADLTPLAVVERILAADRPGGVRATAYQFVTALPPELSLPLARTWLCHDDGRGAAAMSVLGDYAELSDATAVRSALAVSADYWSMTDLVRALGRMPEAGPFPELDEIYVHSFDSYLRIRVVRAMVATDPAFADKWAAECLWDCEEQVRVEGIRAVPLDSTVTSRLRELADDAHEDDSVRSTAACRLRSTVLP